MDIYRTIYDYLFLFRFWASFLNLQIYCVQPFVDFKVWFSVDALDASKHIVLCKYYLTKLLRLNLVILGNQLLFMIFNDSLLIICLLDCKLFLSSKYYFHRFGSFFGPSQPVIASRVIEESRSIRETKHVLTNMSSSVAVSIVAIGFMFCQLFS